MDKTNDKELISIVAQASDLMSQLRSRSAYWEGTGFESIEKALSYPVTDSIYYRDYLARYERQDIANRVIKSPVGLTWKDDPKIFSLEDDSFEETWSNLVSTVDLYSNCSRLDLLARLGRYSTLFLGFNDTTELQNEVRQGSELMYVTPLAEPQATILTWEKNSSKKTYGTPLTYRVTLNIEEGEAATRIVNASRILHVAENIVESRYYGIPALQPIYNRLLGLEKLAGGSPEMYWRGARPGYAASSSGNVLATQEQIDQFKEAVSGFVNNLNRWLYAEDLKIQSLAPQVVSPKEHVDVQIQLISSATRIPVRILIGSERGQLASDQDERAWLSFIEERRDEVAKKLILTPLIDRLITYGALPDPGDYTILWDPLIIVSEKDKADVARTYSAAIKLYDDAVMIKDVIPPEVFLKYILKLDEQALNEAKSITEGSLAEEGIDE